MRGRGNITTIHFELSPIISNETAFEHISALSPVTSPPDLQPICCEMRKHNWSIHPVSVPFNPCGKESEFEMNIEKGENERLKTRKVSIRINKNIFHLLSLAVSIMPKSMSPPGLQTHQALATDCKSPHGFN